MSLTVHTMRDSMVTDNEKDNENYITTGSDTTLGLAMHRPWRLN